MRSLTILGLSALLLSGCHLRHSARPDECLPVAPYDKAHGVASLLGQMAYTRWVPSAAAAILCVKQTG